MMPRVAVVVFDGNGMRLADHVPFDRQDFCEGIPIIGVKNTVLQMLYFLVESSEGCGITIAEHPSHGSPCTTVNGFDDPKLVFLNR